MTTTQRRLAVVASALACLCAGVFLVFSGARCGLAPFAQPALAPAAAETLVQDASGKTLDSGTILRTTDLASVSVSRPEGDYAVLFGARPGVDEEAELQVLDGPPYLFLMRGWVYVKGTRPVVRARRVVAAAEGTEYVIQIDGDDERVFLLDVTHKERLNVTLMSPDDKPMDTATMEVAGNLFLAASGKTARLSQIRPVPDSTDPVGAFFSAALAAHEKFGAP